MIEVHHVSKRFFVPTVRRGPLGALRSLLRREGQWVEAVRELHFSVAAGEFVGYIGPNGAGKSTTIKMLAGILHPTEGDIRVAGHSPQRERRLVARRIGVVFGQRTQLWWDLPVQESYELLAAMYQVPQRQFRARLHELGELLGAGEFLDRPVRKLSLGQRMRADLLGALLHDPPILFLDEPTIGLDVVARRQIRSVLATLHHRGTTILLTTHDLRDIEALCQRVLLLHQGRLLLDGPVEELKRRLGARTRLTAHLRLAIPTDTESLRQAAEQAGFTLVAWSDGQLTVEFDRHRLSAAEAVHRLSAWGSIDDLYLAEPALEDVVEQLFRTGEPPAGPSAPATVSEA